MNDDPGIKTYEESFIKTINIQEVLWTQLKDGFEFKIELINPLKAQITKYKTTDYVRFLVQALSDHIDPEIVNGSILFFQFPLKTWEREMRSLPYSIKKRWNTIGQDNIIIKFKREGSLIKFSEIERVMITEEHKQLAVKYYE